MRWILLCLTHQDMWIFSAEMERTLQVLDYAVLVISGADGVQGHTLTLWSLLERYKIPNIFYLLTRWIRTEHKKDQLLKELQRTFKQRMY